MKIFINYIFLIFILVGFSFGQDLNQIGINTGTNQNLEFYSGDNSLNTGQRIVDNIVECRENDFEIVGNFQLKEGDEAIYNVRSNFLNSLSEKDFISYSLYKEKNEIFLQTGQSIKYKFVELGNYILKVNIKQANGCNMVFTKDISVYKTIFFYIGDEIHELSILSNSDFEKNNILIKKIVFNNNLLFQESELLSKLIENIYYIKNSDIIIINSNQFNLIFEVFKKLDEYSSIEFGKKKMFIIETIGKGIFKSLLPKFMGLLNLNKIYIIDQSFILNVISDYSFNKDLDNLSYINILSINLKDLYSTNVIGYIVDFLIYNKIPTSLIGLFLSIGLCVLIMNFLKQIIGINVFGVFYPLFFGLSMFILGIKISFVLLLIAIISIFITKLFTKLFYVLYISKISISITVYLILFFLFLWIDKFFGINIIDVDLFMNIYFIFPIIIIILVANKIVIDDVSKFFKINIIYLLWFFFVSYIVYFIISLVNLNFYLISNPRLIIFFLILNFVIGRFVGLQLFEYIRFFPLIRKKMEDEEE